MKKIKQIKYKNYLIIQLENKYYLNKPNLNNYILLNSIKYYNINKIDLRLMGVNLLNN